MNSKTLYSLLDPVRRYTARRSRWQRGSVHLIAGTSQEWSESFKIYNSGPKLVLLHFYRKQKNTFQCILNEFKNNCIVSLTLRGATQQGEAGQLLGVPLSATGWCSALEQL